VKDALRFFAAWHALGWMLVAFVIYASLTPAPPSLPVEGGDKLGHVLAYTTLMLWFAWLYRRGSTHLYFALGFVALGIALEFAQGTTDYRSFELADMAADGIGVALGWVIARSPLPNLFVLVERRFPGARR
jgi:VanZ family protein